MIVRPASARQYWQCWVVLWGDATLQCRDSRAQWNAVPRSSGLVWAESHVVRRVIPESYPPKVQFKTLWQLVQGLFHSFLAKKLAVLGGILWEAGDRLCRWTSQNLYFHSWFFLLLLSNALTQTDATTTFPEFSEILPSSVTLSRSWKFGNSVWSLVQNLWRNTLW